MGTFLMRLRSLVGVREAESVALALVTLKLLDVPWFASVLCVLVLLILNAFGNAFGTRFFGTGFGFSTNFVVGCGVFVFLGQIFIAIGIDYRFAHWLSLLILLGSAAVMWLTDIDGTGTESDHGESNAETALALGLVALAIFHMWLVPFAAAVLAHNWFFGHERRAKTYFLGVITMVVGWGVALRLRPEKWWYLYQGSDAQFFESLGWSIARWGVFEHPGLSGGSIASYHWFTYAFFGSMSSVAQLEPWIAIMRIGPLLIAVLLSGLFLSRNLSRTAFTSTQRLTVLLAVLATGILRVDSQTFSLVVAFAVFNAISVARGKNFRTAHYALFILLSVMIMLSKVSTAAIVVTILALSFVVQRNRVERRLIPIIACFIVGFTATYLSLLRYNKLGMLQAGLGFSVDSTLNEIQDFLEPVIILNYLLWVLFFLSARRNTNAVSYEFKTSALSVARVGSVAALTHLLLSGTSTSYFALAGIALITFMMVERFQQHTFPNRERISPMNASLLLLLTVLSIALGFWSSQTIRQVGSRLDFDGRIETFLGRTIISGEWQLVLLVVLLATLAVRKVRVSVPLVLLAAVGLFVGQRAENYSQLRSLGESHYATSDPATAIFASSDLVALGEYVRTNTPTDVILASNQFCGIEQDALYPSEDTDLLLLLYKWSGECDWAGANYLVPAETQRRFLIQGPRFQHSKLGLDAEQIDRLELSLEFANHPSRESLLRLKSFGVSGFVVNLSLTSRLDWDGFAIERFREGEFVYLELN